MNTGLTKERDLEQLIAEAAAQASDEVVTEALSRDVVLPHAGRTAVLITLDNHHDHTRPNTLGPASLGSLNAAIDAALARPEVAAIAITGKQFILAAGADLSAMSKLLERENALSIAQIGHAVYEKLYSSPIPTFGFVNGMALGGGLELPLACHYRTVSSAAAGIALPECFIGLLPGWGGAYSLPNLIGAERAVKVIIENPLNSNTMLTGPQAFGLGIADALFDGADFLERSLDWAGQLVAGTLTVERDPIDRGDAWDAAIARGRKIADAKTSGIAPAPYRALELMARARTTTRAEGFAAEDDALADLIMDDRLRASLYAFDLVRKRARKPAGAPDRNLARTVGRVGIVGAGLMASQLALLFARRLQVPVVMSDLDQDRIDNGLSYVGDEIDKLAAKARLSPDAANRVRGLVTGTTDLADFASCDFVIEAVYEELSVKQQVFAQLEQHVSELCVLATNTSSLSVSAMAAGLTHPERVVGFHFFNPVAVLPLLEVVRGEHTDDAAIATALFVAKELKKNAVLVKDATAFVFNRLLIRLMSEVTTCVDEGTPIQVADTALRPLGLPMTPFALLQLVGPTIALHVTESLNASFGDRFAISPNLQAIVARGLPGIYSFDEAGRPYVSEETARLLTIGDRPSTADQVLHRAVVGLADEIGRLLAEGVVAAPMDVDLCLILGGGWPLVNGGVTPYLDREGISEAVLGRRFLPQGVANVPPVPAGVTSG